MNSKYHLYVCMVLQYLNPKSQTYLYGIRWLNANRPAVAVSSFRAIFVPELPHKGQIKPELFQKLFLTPGYGVLHTP